MTPDGAEGRARRHPRWVDLTILGIATAVFVALVGLGTWQVARLGWKLDLIAAVENRAHGAPVAPPAGPVSAERHAYLRVEVAGRFRHDLSRKVKAVTELGPGHWLLTPLATEDGPVWINRGFLPAGDADAAPSRPDGPVIVEGLLRISEPGGTLLERNDPAAGRWVSRDLAALSNDVGVASARTFFIDADHSGPPDTWPRGGLTVVAFRNQHLVYAITWYIMAALLLTAMACAIRDRMRNRHKDKDVGGPGSAPRGRLAD